MGTIGLVLFGVDVWVRGVDPAVGLVLVPTAVLMYDPLIGPEFRTEDGWRFPARSIAAYLIALGSTVYAVWDLRGDSTGWGELMRYLTVPVMMLVFRGMYEVHLLKGGADAKGMIVLAAFVPQYPEIPSLPLIGLGSNLQGALQLFFPFCLLVLLNAALRYLLAPLAFVAYSAVPGHLEFPVALFGYKVSLDRVPPYVWFMDRIVDGEHVVVYFPAKRQDRAAILRDLRGAGLRDAWVTPQLPFLVPVAIAYVLSF